MTYKGFHDSYNLDRKLAEGGEGAVWSISGKGNVVAKVYHDKKLKDDPKLENKITYMVNNPPADSILDQIAWPKDVLRDNRGEFAGFIMPKLDTDTDLKNIYPYPPKKNMPVTIQQKLIIAINICIVISGVHEAGYIFGDFNPMNIGINLKNGHVAFFDADSYHFTDKNTGETHRCGVGADGYIAPELIQKVQKSGSTFLDTPLPTFTKETDEFALAIHIFKLLMNGYTPFNGIKERESASQASPGTGNLAIERDNYCFKRGKKPQSPATPELSSLPSNVQDLFNKTFIDGSKNPEKRASADEWREALIEYHDNLKQCSNNKIHYYYKRNTKCPFCEADNRYKKSLSGFTQTYSTGSSGSSIQQYSFSNPISVPQNNNSSNVAHVNIYSIQQAKNLGLVPSNPTYSNITTTVQKRKLPLLIRIILWVLFLPIMAAIAIFKKKEWNLLIRLALITFSLGITVTIYLIYMGILGLLVININDANIAVETEMETSKTVYVVTVENANIRSGPNKDIIDSASYGDIFYWTGKEEQINNGNAWYEVYLDDDKTRTGWLHSSVIEKRDEDIENRILGVWRGEHGSKLTLYESGTCYYIDANMGEGEGTWKIDEQGYLRVNTEVLHYEFYGTLNEGYDTKEILMKADSNDWTEETFVKGGS